MAKVKLCKICNKPFNAFTDYYKYCDKCRKKHYYKAKPIQSKKCKQCGKTFITRRFVQKFCCVKCKDSFHQSHIVKTKMCKQCGSVFKCTNNSQIYCKRKCYLIAKRKRDKEFYKKRLKERSKNELS